MTIPKAALQRNIIGIQAVPETDYHPKLFAIVISRMKDGGQMEQTTTKTTATT